jgi:hypothetical protein
VIEQINKCYSLLVELFNISPAELLDTSKVAEIIHATKAKGQNPNTTLHTMP